jgi:hypothetical protein
MVHLPLVVNRPRRSSARSSPLEVLAMVLVLVAELELAVGLVQHLR